MCMYMYICVCVCVCTITRMYERISKYLYLVEKSVISVYIMSVIYCDTF